MEQTTVKIEKDIINHAIDKLEPYLEGTYGADLHHELFNTDYFIIGYYQAEQWLIANPGIFAAIGEIVEYEKMNFGEASTDLSDSEKVANMYAYIKGSELLAASKRLEKKWNEKLTAADIKQIRKEISKLL
jgi:hypothetical protein